MPEKRTVLVTDKLGKALPAATIARLNEEAKAAGHEDVLIVGAEGTDRAEEMLKAVRPEMGRPIDTSAIDRGLDKVEPLHKKQVRSKHGGGHSAVIIGTTEEVRERVFKRGKKAFVATTQIARGVDPKILKAERRAMMRRATGRWDGVSDKGAIGKGDAQ